MTILVVLIAVTIGSASTLEVFTPSNVTYTMNYTVTSRTPNASPVTSTIRIMLDSTSSFYVEHEIPSGKLYAYYDGEAVRKCTQSGNGEIANKTIVYMNNVKDKNERHRIAMSYGTGVLPCPIDPLAETTIFKHCIDISGLYGVAKYDVKTASGFRTYSSNSTSIKYALGMGEMTALKAKSSSHELLLGLLDDKPVPSKQGDTIDKHARIIFSDTFKAMDVTEETLKLFMKK